MVDARALELIIVSPKATCSPSEMTIVSAVVLIFEHNQLSLKVSMDKFPCTRDEWYKYIFWPVHANGGNYPSDPRANTPSPYTQLATTMRAGGTPEHERGSTIYPRTTKITKELGRSLSSPELRKAPPVRLRLQYASLSAYQRVITPKTEASVSIANCADNGTNVNSRFAHPRFVSFYESTTRRINTRRTHLTLKCSWSDRRNSSPTPPLDNTAPSFMRDTMITRAAELMSDMQLFATDTVVSAPPTTQASEVVRLRVAGMGWCAGWDGDQAAPRPRRL